MKYLYFLVIICFHNIGISQKSIFSQPIKPESILSKPGDYIGNEKNLECIVLSGNLDQLVLSPVDGQITRIFYIQQKSLVSNIVYGVNSNIDSVNKKEIIKSNPSSNIKSINELSILISIKTKKNEVFYISGLGFYKKFKTGETIKKGDKIGTLRYFYYPIIMKPSVGISMSINGKAKDPSSYFGIKNSTNSNGRENYKKTLDAKDALSDLEILKNSLLEGYPGLYDYNSQKTIDSLFKSQEVLLQNENQISASEFLKRVIFILVKLKDSHIDIVNFQDYSDEIDRKDNTYWPPVYFGWIGDKAIITRAILKDTIYLGREIKEINRIPSQTIKKYLSDYTYGQDGNIESYPAFILLTFGSFRYFQYFPDAPENRDLELVFENGDTVSFKGYINNSSTCVRTLPVWHDFYFYPENNIETKLLDNKTAFLVLKSFSLNEVEKDTISAFFKKISDSKTENLIIDIRNNSGGETSSIQFLMNFIADSSYHIDLYSVVNKTKFDFFKFTQNYYENDLDYFKQFKYSSKDNKYYKQHPNYIPAKNPNFNGKIYVLTSERTLSAAAIFAGLIKKNKLGVIVGRETRSTFHQIKGEKFANLVLPNSNLIIRFPLVKIILDPLEKDDPNYGRGVLPDYPVNISLAELSMEDGDILLKTALKLIDGNQYFKPIKTKEHSVQKIGLFSNSNKIILLILTAFILAIIFYFIIKKVYAK